MSTNSTKFEDGSHSFGPASSELFDFTPLFENTLLSIVPSAFLLLALPFRIWSLKKESKKVSKSFLYRSKLVVLAVFSALQASILIVYATNSTVRSPSALISEVLVFTDAIGLCFLSHVEHFYSVRPSTVINTYLFTTLLFDIARTRSLWIVDAPLVISGVFTAATIAKLAVAVAEAWGKHNILLSPYQNSSPESISGIYNRSVFWWLNGIIKIGFLRNINTSDLFPLEPSMTSSSLTAHAIASWTAAPRNRSNALFWSILHANRGRVAACIFPRLCLIGFHYAQPFLLTRTVNFVNSGDSDNIGWGLTGAFGIVFLGLAIAEGAYGNLSFRFVTAVRGGLVGLIYRKTVDLSIIALDESAAITLMSNDTETICRALQNIHELWAVPLELALAVWLLQRQLELSFLAPAGVAIVSTACVVGISQYVGNAQKIWNQGIQTRVDVTTSMLGHMKAVKLLGFTDRLTAIIQGLRVKELKIARLWRRQLCVRVFFQNSMSMFCPLVTFGLYVGIGKRELTTATAFTTLTLIGLLSNPINTLLRTIPAITGALGCFSRIQRFLESESRQSHVLPLPHASWSIDNDTSVTAPNAGGDIELIELTTSQNTLDANIMDVRNATFSWSVSGSPTVQDVSFIVRRKDFVFVIGPVGCGKSTLLKGIMGETPSSQGFVYSDTTEIAFVSQMPWIQNITLRKNIIGNSIFDPSWYSQVIRACALDYDITALSNGDSAVVGSRGISLSGGQLQRLSLARAVYSKKKVMIIDDGFSGLDSETEEKVFSRLLGNQGLLRQLGVTVILVTHAVHRLPYSDYIIALNTEGKITEQGTFDQLLRNHGYVEGLATKHKYDSDTKVEESKTKVQQAEEIKATFEDDEPFRPNGELSIYKYYFASIGWSTTLFSLSIFMIAGISEKMTELLIRYWTADVATHGTGVNSLYLGLYGMLTALGTIGYNLGVYHYFLHLVPGSSEELHARLLGSVMRAPLCFFTSTDTGTTTNRFSQDMSIVDGELPFALVDFIDAAIQTLMGAVMMCISTGYFTLIMLPVAFAVWVIQKFYLRTSRQIRLLDLEQKSPLYSHFIESLSGLVTIRSFGWSEAFIEQNLELLDNSQKPYYLLFCIQRWLSLVLGLMVSVLAVILMVLIVKLRHSIGAGYVGLSLLNIIGFSESLSWQVRQWTELETSIGAIARLKSFTETTADENIEDENEPVPDLWPTHGAIEIENLRASYTTDGLSVISDLNMSIKPGEKIGVCGRSGSGKSSLMMTLFRMLEIPPESSITIDGVDITRIPRQIVRARLNAIPQESFFMKGSIRFNVSPDFLHSDEDIVVALCKVHLWSVVESKGGLDAELDPEFFSHGQCQLFCLARAILRQSKVVVLDEVSSNIDVTTDKLIQQVIRQEFAGTTIIAIAHRLDTIMDFDRVALMSDGKMVEFASPQSLMNSSSCFRDLYNS